MERNVRRRSRRRERRAQIGVALLAALAGIVAGLLGTHRTWERLPKAPASTSTTNPAGFPTP